MTNFFTKKYIGLALVLLLIAVTAGSILYNSSAKEELERESVERESLRNELLAVTPDDHVYGLRDAPIKLIEYGDINCQYCRVLYPRLKNVVDAYPESVAFVYRHIPIYGRTDEVSRGEIASECVHREKGDAGFFSYLDTLFEKLPSNRQTAEVPFKILTEAAEEVGVEQSTLEACIESEYRTSLIKKQHGSGGALGVYIVPHTFIVSDKAVYDIVGAEFEEVYRKIVESMLGSQESSPSEVSS
ncbi:MAG: thioredoxin domain-containing protein [Candidatus Paceibacterota bacterium]